MNALVLALALAATPPLDPCAPVEDAAVPDAAEAAEYRAVAEAEQAAGRPEPAVAAWRAAAALAPADPRARAALDALCRGTSSPGPFDRGLAAVKAGRCAEALAPLEEARAAGDRAAALLAGICRYEAGDDAEAAALLAEAELSPGTRDAARFFRGLLALRRGRADEAVALLDASAGDGGLAPLAAELSRTARRSGRLVLSLALESGWDSNVDLAPGGSPAPSGASDLSGGAAGALTFAPDGERGPYARTAASVKRQAAADAYDLDGAAAAAGWQVGRGPRAGLVELGWEYRRLGGAPLLWSVRGLAAGRARLGERWLASLSWETSLDDYLQASRDAYGGLQHTLEAELSTELAGGTASAALRASHDGAEEAALALRELGPRVSLRRPLARGWRTALDLGWTWLRADSTDPILGKRREDHLLDAAAALEVELGARFTLRLSCAGRLARSNVGELSYSRIVPSVGLSYVRGLL